MYIIKTCDLICTVYLNVCIRKDMDCITFAIMFDSFLHESWFFHLLNSQDYIIDNKSDTYLFRIFILCNNIS